MDAQFSPFPDAPLHGKGAVTKGRNTHRRSVIGAGEGTSHHPLGVDGGGNCNEDLCKKLARCSYPPENGQQNSNIIYQSHGRHQVIKPFTGSLRAVVVVSPKRNYIISQTSPWVKQHSCRPGVMYSAVISRMDDGQSCLSQDLLYPWSLSSGLICIEAKQSVEKVHQLASRSICMGNRCLPDFMSGHGRICIA